MQINYWEQFKNPTKTTALFKMPVKSVEQLPTLVLEPLTVLEKRPLSGAELQRAIVEALFEEEALIEDEAAHGAAQEAERERNSSKKKTKSPKGDQRKRWHA